MSKPNSQENSVATVVRGKTSGKRIYEELKKAAINGIISFEEPLSEESLAKMFGVSRTPVREAVFQLVQEGLITKKDNSYLCVRRITEPELEDLAEVRVVLNKFLIDKLISNLDEKIIEQLERNVESCKKLMDEESRAELNYALSEFHSIMFAGARSPCLEKLMRGTLDQVLLSRAVALKFPGIRRMLISDHEKILIALKKKDKAEAKKRMSEHISNTKKKALEVLLRDRLARIASETETR